MNSILSYSPETAKLGCDLCDIDFWPLTLTFCMHLPVVIGNNSWTFHDDTIMGTLSKRCDGQTDGRTDRRTDRRTDGQTEKTICRAARSQLKRTIQSPISLAKKLNEMLRHFAHGKYFYDYIGPITIQDEISRMKLIGNPLCWHGQGVLIKFSQKVFVTNWINDTNS